jgi:DNA-binding transcriptional LysR family regulator
MAFNLDRLRSFIVVSRLQNLSAAAKELGMTQPNLGRQMTALENELKLTLFVRHSRGLALTKQGQEFLDLCHDIVGRLAQGTDVIRGKGQEPHGHLKVLSGIGVLENILENIENFSDGYPKFAFTFSTNINIYELQINIYELQIGDADILITPDVIHDRDYVQRHLFDTTMRVYASPHYLQVHSRPRTLNDLKDHRVLIYVGEKQEILNKPIRKPNDSHSAQSFLELTSGPMMRTALVNSAGIGCYAYNRNLLEKGLLVDVFPNLPDHIIPYYFTFHKRLDGSPKIEAFYKFLKEVTKVWEWRHAN